MDDLVNRAMRAAQNGLGVEFWECLSRRAQVEAIYLEMRKIDLQAARERSFQARRTSLLSRYILESLPSCAEAD